MREYKDDLICPFCQETDFDWWGLKIHLINHCDFFNDLTDQYNTELYIKKYELLENK